MAKFLTAKVLHEDYAKKFKDTRFNVLAKTADGSQESDDVILNELDVDDFLYLEITALTCGKNNANGDLFVREEIERITDAGIPVYKTFVGCGVFKDHKSSDVDQNIGVIWDAELVENPDPNKKDCPSVRLIIGIDKRKAEDIARGYQIGRLRDFSMGCSIAYSTCTLCQKKILDSETDLCDCLKYHHNEYINGVQVGERLFGCEFSEISTVTNGADQTAKLINILAGTNQDGRIKKVAFSNDINLIEMIYNKVMNGKILEKIKILDELK